MRYRFIIILFILRVSCFGVLMAQDGISTNKTDRNKRAGNSREQTQSKNKRYMIIFKPNTRGILYGNPCIMEVTRKMGFEYSVAPKGTPGYKTELGRVLHNFGVKTVLFFKNPFWKIKVKRKVEECRIKTGDYTG